MQDAYDGQADVDLGLSESKIRPEWKCSFKAYFTVVFFYLDIYPPPYRFNQTVRLYDISSVANRSIISPL